MPAAVHSAAAVIRPVRSGVFILQTFSSLPPAAHLCCTWRQPPQRHALMVTITNTHVGIHISTWPNTQNSFELLRTVKHHHHLCLPSEFFSKQSFPQRDIRGTQLVAHTHTHTHFCPHLVTIQRDVRSLCCCLLKRTLSQPSVSSVLQRLIQWSLAFNDLCRWSVGTASRV